ncbi:MAG: hypothetical protein IT165_35930 [Bryobacterales bacterium]|nr:hypothetical protein [Bryobacterales bacterium]
MTYDELAASLREELKPSGDQENEMFHQFLEAAWRLRVWNEEEYQLSEKAGGDALLSEVPAIQKKAARIQRLRTRTESAFYRSLNRLKKLQAERARRQEAGKKSAARLAGLETPPHIM